MGTRSGRGNVRCNAPYPAPITIGLGPSGPPDFQRPCGSRDQRHALFGTGLPFARLAIPSLMLASCTQVNDAPLELTLATVGLPILATAGAAQAVDLSSGWSLDVADWEGDGDLDVLRGNSNGLSLLLNEDSVLTELWDANTGGDALGVALGDLDGDLDVDIVAGLSSGSVGYWANEGGIPGAMVTVGTVSTYVSGISLGDFDSDGDLDIGAATQSGIWAFSNTSLSFASTQVASGAQCDSLAFGDRTGDGQLDLICGGSWIRLHSYDQPTSSWVQEAGGSAGDVRAVVWVDWDADGDLDVAAARQDTSGAQSTVYHVAPSIGHQAMVPLGTENRSFATAVGRVNADAFPDAVLGTLNTIGATSTWDGPGVVDELYLGAGLSTPSLGWSSSETYRTRATALADMDGDSDLDLLALTWEGGLLSYENPSSFRLSLDSEINLGCHVGGLAIGDVDGDLDGDLAVGCGGVVTGQADYVLLTDSAGPEPSYFDTAAAASFNSGTQSRRLSWGDVDSDGDLDLAVTNVNAPAQVFSNGGAGLAALPNWQSQSASSGSVAWGELNGDAWLDLVVGYEAGPMGVEVYLGSAGGLPTVPSQAFGTWEVRGIDLGDMNTDGFLDIAVATYLGDPDRVWTNGGSGQFSEGWVSSETSGNSTFSVAWGDVNGDGLLDLATGHDPVQPNRLYLNVAGTLEPTASWESSESDSTIEVAWGDPDGDGDQDLVAGNWGYPSRIYKNSGGTLEATASWSTASSRHVTSALWEDVDLDGDLDFLLGSEFSDSRISIYENTLRVGRQLANNPIAARFTPLSAPSAAGAHSRRLPSRLLEG